MSPVIPHSPLRTWLEVDGAALRKNLAILRAVAEKHAGKHPAPKLIAMVKSNAYGHGPFIIPEIAKYLGAGDAIGLADLDELRALRASAVTDPEAGTVPVFLSSPVLPQELEEALALKGWPVLSTYAEAATLAKAAEKLGVTAEAHFKVDTGMGRLGLPPAEAAAELRAILAKLPRVRIVGLMTHFASADSDAALTRRQLALFETFRAQFPGIPWHAANSPGLLHHPRSVAGAAWVRPGLALYGLPTRPTDTKRFGLRPVLTWKARVTFVRAAAKGTTVSYGATYTLPKAQTLATVSVGYGDTYPRHLSNTGIVLIGGVRCPIRGRVTMDQIVVDASRVPQRKLHAGAEAVLLGKQGKEEITADELARLADTISYEIVTGTSLKLPRVYKNF